MIRQFLSWMLQLQTRRKLEALSDHQLRDIGLFRNEILYRSREAAQLWSNMHQS